MADKSIVGEIWLVAIPLLVKKDDNSFDTTFQIRPFLMIDEGKGVLVEENPDYLGVKITTKKNKLNKAKEIKNWRELGLKEKSFVRIEIPERIEKNQLIAYITKMPQKQFMEFYKEILNVFNIEIIQQLIESEKETV